MPTQWTKLSTNLDTRVCDAVMIVASLFQFRNPTLAFDSRVPSVLDPGGRSISAAEHRVTVASVQTANEFPQALISDRRTATSSFLAKLVTSFHGPSRRHLNRGVLVPGAHGVRVR